jgi:Fe2+ or Zn2+ uptake regulation protein
MAQEQILDFMKREVKDKYWTLLEIHRILNLTEKLSRTAVTRSLRVLTQKGFLDKINVRHTKSLHTAYRLKVI